MPTVSLVSLKFTSAVNAFGLSPERGIYPQCCDKEGPRSRCEKKQVLGFSQRFMELHTMLLNLPELLVKAPQLSEVIHFMCYFLYVAMETHLSIIMQLNKSDL